MRQLEQQLKKEPDNVDIPECPEITKSGKRISFDLKSVLGMVPDVVNKVPHDIDGTRFFIEVPQEDPFHTKGFRGVRRVGKCRGSFRCNNNGCSNNLESFNRNQH